MSLNSKAVLLIGVSTMDYQCELDHFPIPDEKVRTANFSLEGGGNAANTAVALARLGCQTKILSRVGNDAFGSQCVALFQTEGVDTSLLQIDTTPTPFSFILIDSSQHTRTIIHCSKPPVINYAFAPSHLEHIDLLYADGRYIDSYAQLIAEASRQGIKIAIEAERKNLNSSAYFPFANIVFVSRQFHKEVFGNKAYESNLDLILSQGPEIAVTTLGSDGVIVKTKDQCIKDAAIPISPIDTTGAGDAFNAAFLYGLLNRCNLQKTTSFATLYAAESCKKIGSRSGLLRKNEIKEIP